MPDKTQQEIAKQRGLLTKRLAGRKPPADFLADCGAPMLDESFPASVLPEVEKCGNHREYKGARPPTCNGGNPCKACLLKYERERDKQEDSRDRSLMDNVFSRDDHPLRRLPS